MQIANITLDVGGDQGNQVPKYGVTAAEIAVLRAIHGEGAVHDVEPVGTVQRSNRDERLRLLDQYGRALDSENHSIVDNLFPGAAARVFETLDELGLPEEFFKATARAKVDPLDHDGDGKKGGSKARKKKADAEPEPEAQPEPEPPVEDSGDSVEDMPDADGDGEKLFG